MGIWPGLHHVEVSSARLTNETTSIKVYFEDDFHTLSSIASCASLNTFFFVLRHGHSYHQLHP